MLPDGSRNCWGPWSPSGTVLPGEAEDEADDDDVTGGDDGPGLRPAAVVVVAGAEAPV